ncbi:FtsX-like permease family protein [Chondrinema litorale]|uniref:FtsX-like permease family protein n=1 Tax=Chondrinema litorale TaxID=2994555 RepID=UPI0025435815|nr:FtsX-like permease family protein [Chondrinema litorale]UZR97943.1 ABC transporter permease [Chondrinema litorale]
MNLQYLLTNYLKIIFRQLKRNKLFSVINVAGLAIGFTLCFFLLLFILNELSYENFHKKGKSIARITMHIQDANYDMHWARINQDWINKLPESYPEIKKLIRFQDYEPRNIQVGDDAFKIQNAYTTDAAVFEVFDFQFIDGNPDKALVEPHSVVLTQSLANQFFGTDNVLNKDLYILNKTGTEKELYKVTGVIEDVPENTHLPVNMLTSFSSENDRTGWAYTYLLLENETDITALQAKLPDFIKDNLKAEDAAKYTLPLQSLKDIHLHSDLAREIKANGNISYLYIFAIVALFILIMSAINFINLNVAQSLKRLREIGMRKVLGSSKANLKFYFLLEANVVTFLAAFIGVLLVYMLLPYFQQFLPIASNVTAIVPFALLFSIIIGSLAGYYPAFILSKSNIILAVKNKTGFNPANKIFGVKNFLIAFQLVLCIVLISSALITQSQFEFLVNKNLGFEKEQILAITNVPQPVKYKYDFVKNEINQIAGIQGVCGVMQIPTEAIRDTGPVYAEGKTEGLENPIVMDIQVVDSDFLDVLNVDLLAGRSFKAKPENELSEEVKNNLIAYLQSEPREYIINETAMKMVGWQNAEEAIGKQFGWSIGDINLQRGEIVGVIKDYHQESLKSKIDPVVLINEPVWLNNILLKVDGKDIRQTIADIENVWKDNFPAYSLEYAFLDDLYNRLYEKEQQQLRLIYLFSTMAIVIAFLGIFGMLSYTLKTKEKEIAVRKILGANLTSIFVLLSKNFIILTIIGTIVTIPLTWVIMERWLQNYVYRIEISTVNFMLALAVILFVLIVTVSMQLGKVSRNNPAETLKAE